MSKPNEIRLRMIQRLTLIVTVATLTLSSFRYGGMRLLNCQRAAGQAFVLPAANGKRGKYRFFIGTTITSNTTTIHTATGSDVISGFASIAGGSSNGPTFATASNTNTITMNGTTQGGILGSYVELEDVGAGQWRVKFLGVGSGALATPFSNS